MVRKGPTNINLKRLISKLRKQKKPIWKRIADDLERPARIRRVVNISRINRYAKDGETVVVPGKVLGDGIIEKKITVAAFKFSKTAREKIEKAGGLAISIEEILEKNPDGRKVRIIG